MDLQNDSTPSVPRSTPGGSPESLFERPAPRAYRKEDRQADCRQRETDAQVEVNIELAPDGDRALRRGADVVGLTPTVLLRGIVVRLCREVEAEEMGVPSFLETCAPSVEATPRKTRILRRILLRRVDERRLHRTAAAVECPLSALVARRVARLRSQIESVSGDAPTNGPLDTYRHLLAVLHGGAR